MQFTFSVCCVPRGMKVDLPLEVPSLTESLHLHYEFYIFMMSLLAVSLGYRFCVSRNGGTGGGGIIYHMRDIMHGREKIKRT